MNNDQNATAPLDTTGAESTARSVVSDLKDAASQKFDEAVTEVRTKADGAKSDVAGDMNDVASALRRASEELRSGSAQERTLGQISRSLADASDHIRDKDLGEMAQMASKLARDNPILFLGGAALLGFAASRFAKASRDHGAVSPNRDSAEKSNQMQSYIDKSNADARPMPTVPS